MNSYKENRNAAFKNLREMGLPIRSAMRDAIKYAREQEVPVVVADVRAALNVAARACYLNGATPAQIDYIIALCEDRGDFAGLERTTRLSKGEASAIIDIILNPLASPADVEEDREEARAAESEAYRAHEARKEAWIAENYPDYKALPSKKRKKIRHKANKAVAA